MKQIFIKAISSWLPLAAAMMLLCSIIYIAVQQTLRRGADDVPVQNIWNVKQDLQNGLSPEQVVAQYRKIDMQNSLEPFIIIYDATGKPLAASVTLNNAIPKVPQGVLAYTEKAKENRLTWQPALNVRNAITIIPYISKVGPLYILSGRSLYEIEKRERSLIEMCIDGMITILIATFILTFITEYFRSKQQKHAR